MQQYILFTENMENRMKTKTKQPDFSWLGRRWLRNRNRFWMNLSEMDLNQIWEVHPEKTELGSVALWEILGQFLVTLGQYLAHNERWIWLKQQWPLGCWSQKKSSGGQLEVWGLYYLGDDPLFFSESCSPLDLIEDSLTGLLLLLLTVLASFGLCYGIARSLRSHESLWSEKKGVRFNSIITIFFIIITWISHGSKGSLSVFSDMKPPPSQSVTFNEFS